MKKEQLLELMEEAIDTAREARLRYLRAEDIAENRNMKRMFRLLAAEQAKHERQLRSAYRLIRRDIGYRIIRGER